MLSYSTLDPYLGEYLDPELGPVPYLGDLDPELVPEQDPEDNKFLKLREKNIKNHAAYHKYTPLISNAIGTQYFYCQRFKELYYVLDESKTLSESVYPRFELCTHTYTIKRILEMNGI